MTSGPLPTGSGGLVWDAENRLIAANITGGDTVHYVYDSQSRRIARTVGTDTTLFVYDAWNVIAEYSMSVGVSPTLSKTHLWGTDLSGSMQGAGGVGGLLAVTDHSSSTSVSHFPTYDGNGNISEYLDATGTIAAHFEYDPFGNTVVNTDTANQFPYRFSTKPIDITTGLYYYGYRFYDPATGRWPSRDPIEEEGGLNLLAYLSNDTTNGIELLGLEDKKNCVSASVPLSLNFNLPRVPVGPFTVTGGIKITGEIKVEKCDTCCDGEIKSEAYEKGSASVTANLNARATLGIDRKVTVNGLGGSAWAGLQFFGQGGGGAEGNYESKCGSSKKYDLFFTTNLGGGVRGGANLSLIYRNLTWQQFGGYVEGSVGTKCKFKVYCDGEGCGGGFEWLGCTDNYGTINAVFNLGSFSTTIELYNRN